MAAAGICFVEEIELPRMAAEDARPDINPGSPESSKPRYCDPENWLVLRGPAEWPPTAGPSKRAWKEIRPCQPAGTHPGLGLMRWLSWQ